MSEQHLTDTPFSSLGLSDSLLQGIEKAGFTLCTPIQAETLPVALAGKDVAGQAQTGTGKTAAFLLATMDRLIKIPPIEGRKQNQPRAIIIAPTRELAVQIHKDALVLGRFTGLTLGLVFGGTGYESQRLELEAGVDILIGTPGRLIDYFKQGVYNLKAIQVVVLDEADRMFDLGFIKDIRYMFRRMPKPEERLGMLFSATLALRVTELAYEHMNHPELVDIEPEKVTADKVRQVVYYPANDEKIPLLIGLMERMDPGRSIVFVNTKHEAERVWRYLEGNDINAALLTGDVPQKKRLSLLAKFTNGEIPVMVATDVAARGLHISDVSHVFNYDLPQDSEDYVHRIGRTARLGASGDAISFACERSAASLPEIESYIGIKIPMESITEELLAKPKPPVKARPASSGRPHKPGANKQRNSRNSRPGRHSNARARQR